MVSRNFLCCNFAANLNFPRFCISIHSPYIVIIYDNGTAEVWDSTLTKFYVTRNTTSLTHRWNWSTNHLYQVMTSGLYPWLETRKWRLSTCLKQLFGMWKLEEFAVHSVSWDNHWTTGRWAPVLYFWQSRVLFHVFMMIKETNISWQKDLKPFGIVKSLDILW